MLNYEQGLCAVRIFLNSLGLIVDEIDKFDKKSTINIFDNNMNKVGSIYLDNGKILISAYYNHFALNASYTLPAISSFKDYECVNMEYALYGNWENIIKYKIDCNEFKVDGNFFIDSSIDTEYGLSCLCHHLIFCKLLNKIITIKILEDGFIFGVEIKDDNIDEKIQINPFDDLNGFFIHTIQNIDSYKKYSGIFLDTNDEENKDKLHLFLKESKGSKTINYRSTYVSKIINEDNNEQAIIQKGMLMQKLDSSMYDAIKMIRNILKINNVYFLDNLISISYDNYTDNEIEALLGIKRDVKLYQDEEKDLISAYFGIKSKNCLKFIHIKKE